MAFSVADCGVALLAAAAVLATSVGMFGDVRGGGLPPTAWIAWHAVLMVLGFPCLMLLGRWTYLADGSVLEGKAARRQAHRTLMILAVLAVLGGYLSVFLAHWPTKQFFGYSFQTQVWETDKVRRAHVYVGYAAIVLVLSQAAMGVSKLQMLSRGEDKKIYSKHGNLGKAILVLGCVNMALAVKFWAWGLETKLLLWALTALCAAVGAFWPSEGGARSGEGTPLVAPP